MLVESCYYKPVSILTPLPIWGQPSLTIFGIEIYIEFRLISIGLDNNLAIDFSRFSVEYFCLIEEVTPPTHNRMNYIRKYYQSPLFGFPLHLLL